jgi:pyrimidine-nucleoside phosphorylase
VLDVKCGSGAFMKTLPEADALAQSMVNIARAAGLNSCALITDMDTPLGFAVGNILEVKEAIETLRGEGPKDLEEICIALSASMVSLAENIPLEEARRMAKDSIKSGLAMKKFKEWICAQGGNTDFIDDTSLFPSAKYQSVIKAPQSGYIKSTDTEKIGLAAAELGAGRKTKDDKIDYTAGIVIHKKTGDRVEAGEKIATLHTSAEENLPAARELLLSAFSLSDIKPKEKPLIYKIIFQ